MIYHFLHFDLKLFSGSNAVVITIGVFLDRLWGLLSLSTDVLNNVTQILLYYKSQILLETLLPFPTSSLKEHEVFLI